jgi:hypothetical protein
LHGGGLSFVKLGEEGGRRNVFEEGGRRREEGDMIQVRVTLYMNTVSLCYSPSSFVLPPSSKNSSNII